MQRVVLMKHSKHLYLRKQVYSEKITRIVEDISSLNLLEVISSPGRLCPIQFPLLNYTILGPSFFLVPYLLNKVGSSFKWSHFKCGTVLVARHFHSHCESGCRPEQFAEVKAEHFRRPSHDGWSCSPCPCSCCSC